MNEISNESDTGNPYTIILFYKYTHIENPNEFRDAQRKLCEKLGLTGRIIVAHEGINATLEGKTENINAYLNEFLGDLRFADTHIKKSNGIGTAFPKLSVKSRREIVSLHLHEDFSPTEVTGVHLKPADLKQWFKDGKDFEIVDMRNDYEYSIGRFKGSVLPKLQNFRDVPRVLSELEPLKEKTVVAVCTGGVRCEKASGFLLKNGFKNVYQLDGGIVSYMQEYPGQEFEGSLYVFDKRITMSFDSDEQHIVIGTCQKCNTSSERYVNCKWPECNKHFICCEICSENDGKSFCSEGCKEKMII
ncbi:MAG: rhodanese-related sulfurtransferase [Patescibacteria group bacterium]